MLCVEGEVLILFADIPFFSVLFQRFFGYVGKDEIQALCPIRNYLWMGTSQGKLRVIHAPSLKVKYSGKLFQGVEKGSAVLKILHIQEEACVFVSVHSGHIWCLRDHLVEWGLFVEQHLAMDDQYSCGPVYDLVDAKVDGVQQVWGTMDNNTLLLLEKREGEWVPFFHKLCPFGTHMRYCSHIVYCNFVDEESHKEQHHLWVSYQNKGGLVCFDAQQKKQRHSFNCSEVLQSSDGKWKSGMPPIVRLLYRAVSHLKGRWQRRWSAVTSCD